MNRRIAPQATRIRRFRRSVVAAFALALLVLLLLPPIFGQMARPGLTTLLEGAKNGSELVARTQLDTGWFSSRAVVTIGSSRPVDERTANVDLPMPMGTPMPIRDLVGALTNNRTLEIVLEFAHGPVGWLDGVFVGRGRGVGRLHLDDETQKAMEEMLGTPELIVSRVNVDFGGQSDWTVDLSPFCFVGDGTGFCFSGAKTTATLSPDLEMVLRGGEAELEFIAPDRTLKISDMEITQNSGCLAQADNERCASRLSLPTVSLEENGVRVFETRGFVAESVTQADDDGEVWTSSSVVSIESVRTAKGELTDARIETLLRNLDREVLFAGFSPGNRSSVHEPAATKEAPPETDGAKAWSRVLEALQSSPEFTLGSVQGVWTPTESDPHEFRGSLRIRVDGASVSGDVPPEEAFSLLGALHADAKIETSKSLALEIAAGQVRTGMTPLVEAGHMTQTQAEAQSRSMAEAMLAQLTAQGILSATPSGYAVEAELSESRLQVNGHPIPLNLSVKRDV